MKTKLLTALLCLLPLLTFSQNYEKEGDDLFAQAQYEQAEKKYKAAIAVQGESQPIKQKQDKCTKCKNLLTKAQTAEKESRYSDAAKYYSNLYSIHSLQKYKSKANAMKQEVQKIEDEKQAELNETIFIVVEKMPEFPGGKEEMEKYLSKNTKNHVKTQNTDIHGTAYCQFVVNRDGSLTDVVVVRSSGNKSLDEEAIRIIKSMPKWNPGKQRGKAVRVTYTLPIRF